VSGHLAADAMYGPRTVMKRWLITGASSGFGRLLAERVAAGVKPPRSRPKRSWT